MTSTEYKEKLPSFKNEFESIPIFTWRIPSITETEKDIICSGYVRTNYRGYIVREIIELFMLFYVSNNTSNVSLNDIIKAKPGSCVDSRVFLYRARNWFLRLYANGYENEEGKLELKILEHKQFRSDRGIKIKYKMKLLETNSQCIGSCERSYNRFWDNNIVLFEHIKHLEQITFETQILIDNTTTSDNPLHNEIILLPISKYRWRIDNPSLQIEQKGVVLSKIISLFGMKWFLSMYLQTNEQNDNELQNVVVEVELIYFPSSVSSFQCKYKTITFQEINKSNEANIYHDMSDSVKQTMRTDLTLDQLKKFDTATIDFELLITSILLEDCDVNPMKSITSDKDENFQFKEICDEKLPNEEYIWNVTNEVIKEMKSVKDAFEFSSKIFEAHSLKWRVDFYINKNNACGVCLRLVSLPALTSELIIAAKCGIIIEEINYKYENINNFKRGFYTLESIDNAVATLTENIKSVNTLTIKAQIALINVVYDDKLITNQYTMKYNKNHEKEISIPSQNYLWKIGKRLLVTKMEGCTIESKRFELFSLKWFLSVYPNNEGWSQISVTLKSDLPTDTTALFTKCIVHIFETNTRVTVNAEFTSDVCTLTALEKGILSTKEFCDLNKCTIKLEIQLIDAIDGMRNTTSRFIDDE